MDTVSIPDGLTPEELFTESLLFQSLDEQALEELMKAAEIVQVEPGEMVIEEGARDEYVYLVRKGSLSAWTVRTGEEVKLGHLETGAVFGEVAELGQTSRTATVKAETSCELVRFQGERFMEIIGRFPKAREALTNIVLKRASENLDKTM